MDPLFKHESQNKITQKRSNLEKPNLEAPALEIREGV